MTDMQNSFVQRKSKLNSFNISPPRLSQKNDGDEEISLVPSIKKEAITIVRGIGLKVAEKLNGIGVYTVKELAHSTPEEIAKIPGIGLVSAQKYISSAKEHVRMKKINNFSDSNDGKNVKLEDLKNLEKTFLKDVEHSIEDYEFYENTNDILDFDDKSYENTTQNIKSTTLEQLDSENSPQSSPRVVVPLEVGRQLNLALQDNDTSHQEVLSREQTKEFLMLIVKKLKLSEFTIIERSPQLRAVFTGIDLLGIKHVRVKEFLDIIYIIPIKISFLKGSFIVSNDSIQYSTIRNSNNTHFQAKKFIQSYLHALCQANMNIYSDIMNEGALLRNLSKYLGMSITIEKSITRKNLFFHSGPLQHKILIEPVLVSQNCVGFTEKIIPFAYQKNSNIHIVELSKFEELLHYLDQKYFLIETYSEEKNAVVLNCEATNKFIREMRKYSSPFMGYGFVILFVLLSQQYSVLSLLINLGYGVFLIYIALITYLYLKLHKEKLALYKEFSTPYYQKDLNFDDSMLILINEELNSRLMDQFIYECVGKDLKLKFLHGLEKEHSEDFLFEKIQKSRVEGSTVFEEDIPMNSEVGNYTSMQNMLEKFTEKNKFIDKYSSFLED